MRKRPWPPMMFGRFLWCYGIYRSSGRRINDTLSIDEYSCVVLLQSPGRDRGLSCSQPIICKSSGSCDKDSTGNTYAGVSCYSLYARASHRAYWHVHRIAARDGHS